MLLNNLIEMDFQVFTQSKEKLKVSDAQTNGQAEPSSAVQASKLGLAPSGQNGKIHKKGYPTGHQSELAASDSEVQLDPLFSFLDTQTPQQHSSLQDPNIFSGTSQPRTGAPSPPPFTVNKFIKVQQIKQNQLVFQIQVPFISLA